MTDFAEDPARRAVPDHPADMLLLNLDGFEGPIDVLLQLARDQKVDLAKISILQLTRQFLTFMERAKAMNLDLAAEYLVMAAWLAYLKSRLLLPRDDTAPDEPSAEAMADALAYQLKRLEAMQNAAHALQSLPQRGRDIFSRGYLDPDDQKISVHYTATLYDLLKAYGDIRARAVRGKKYELATFHLMSMDEALTRLTSMLGALPKSGPHTVWTTLSALMPEEISVSSRRRPGPPSDEAPAGAPNVSGDPGFRRDDALLYTRSSLASLLTASLEMAKQGKIELRQDSAFKPVYLRGRTAPIDPKEEAA